MTRLMVAALALVAGFAAAPALAGGNYDKAKAAAPVAAEAAQPAGDIVAVATAAGQFNTLASLLTAADLVTTLQGSGPFTVFAPTDAAFAKLPAETLADLQKPENKAQLTKILTAHVVPGVIKAADLAGKTETPATVEGGTLSIDLSGASPKIGGATVSTADVAASNGVIHIIDSVILPE